MGCKKKLISITLFLAAYFGLSFFVLLNTASAANINAQKWEVVEIPLTSTAATAYPNAYTQVDVAATFTKGTITKTVKGFWNGQIAGKDTFKVRFTPTETGSWNYAITAKNQATGAGLSDTGLQQSGTINVSGTDAVNNKGFIRVDPDYPTTFVHDDGTRHLMFGTTEYSIMHNAMDGGYWERDLDYFSQKGINKVRMLIHTFDWAYMSPAEPPMKYLNSQPFLGTSRNPSHDWLDVPYWQKLDEVVEYMAAKGINAELILFSSFHSGALSKTFGTDEQDKRYSRYVVSRYAAYPNIIFDLVNEYDVNPVGRKELSWWNQIGNIAYTNDPWHFEGNKRRPLSIHAWNEINFDFFKEEWPSYAILQYNGQQCYNCAYTIPRIPDVWGYDGIAYNLRKDMNFGNKMPVVNDEYGYAGMFVTNKPGPFDTTQIPWTGCSSYGRTMNRQTMWSIYAAGGYATMGDSYRDGWTQMEQIYKYPPFPAGYTYGWYKKGWQPFIIGDVDTTDPIGIYKDAEVLIDFFTTKGIEYWKMTSSNNLLTSGSRTYVLANPGIDYVVYDALGTAFNINIQSGKAYAVYQFNPRTGAETSLPNIPASASSQTITPPAGGEDWVYRIKAVVMPQCSNGIDDDGDGKKDFGYDGTVNDSGCTHPEDNTEAGDPTLGNGLVARWTMDSLDINQGIAFDRSTYNNHGLVSGTTEVAGKIGQARHLNGTSDNITVASDPSFATANGTIAAWFKLDSLQNNQSIVGRDANGCTGNCGHFSLKLNAGKLEVRLQNNGSDYYLYSDNTKKTIAINTWYHAAVTYGSQGMQMYVDGVLHDTDVHNEGISGNLKTLFIGDYYNSGYNFKGALDDVRIYNRQLTSQEITELVNPSEFKREDVNNDTYVNIKDIQICIKAITAPGSIPTGQLQKCKELAPPTDKANIKDIQVIIRCIIDPNCGNQ